MKATNTLLSTIIIGVTLIIMTGCSQGEDLIDAGTQALNAATNNDKELVLTASEQIALSVKQKGSYDISEKEAKKKSENSAPNRFCSKDFLSEAAKPDKQLPK